MRALLGALGLLLGACAGAGARPEPQSDPGLPLAPELVLPADWHTLAPADFEAWVLEALPEDRATPLEKHSLRELQRALDVVTAVQTPPDAGATSGAASGVTEAADAALPLDPLAVRAAVILGRSRYPSSAAVLIRRLERRVLGPERYSDCGDAVAAAALARFPDPRRYAQRLVPLATGSRPHPDLEVRVECAATALHAGFVEVVPFLLAVLRIDTFAGQADQRDFPVSPTTAWARGRAAEALSSHAGVPLSYRFDGSIAHREQESARLAALLLPAQPATPEPPEER